MKQRLLFLKQKQKITNYLNFRLSGQKIHVKNNVKYLDITIQNDLGWEIHVNMVARSGGNIKLI